MRLISCSQLLFTECLLIAYHFVFPAAEVFPQFQYAVRVVGSNFAPTVERDEFLVAEKIKKECEFEIFISDCECHGSLHGNISIWI